MTMLLLLSTICLCWTTFQISFAFFTVDQLSTVLSPYHRPFVKASTFSSMAISPRRTCDSEKNLWPSVLPRLVMNSWSIRAAHSIIQGWKRPWATSTSKSKRVNLLIQKLWFWYVPTSFQYSINLPGTMLTRYNSIDGWERNWKNHIL